MSGVLGLGKVSREVFERSVLPFIPVDKELELDGATVRLTDRTVISHSPSIGVPLEALGFFAFHYAASNVACRFGRPTHMITGIYLPLKTREEDLKTIAKSLGDEAKKYGVKIAAGQTATYYGLEIPFVSTTCLGEQTRKPSKPIEGDIVLLVGEVGGEAAWLTKLSGGASDESWRKFTALQTILALGEVEGVKLLHDVSEGGVKGALTEVLTSLGLSLSFNSGDVAYAKGAQKLHQDLLRAPTYGTIIVIVDSASAGEIIGRCSDLGVEVTRLGPLRVGSGLTVDGKRVGEQARIEIDELYGSFRKLDELEESVSHALEEIERLGGAGKIIPQVGLNMVYAKPDAMGPLDVVGLNGRVIVSRGRPKACGEVEYGGSRFLASVIVEAQRRDSRLRAAVVLRGGEDVAGALIKMGKRVVGLPPEAIGEGCPVARFIFAGGNMADAYSHPGAFGIEPTTTILDETPSKLIDTLRELLRNV
ncbi:MAG: AIR synthase related protein [Candidatus Bathyarchaeota archaeon]|nr:AIR synthase related protein [Candidatus Bathyarchaeota archaeon]